MLNLYGGVENNQRYIYNNKGTNEVVSVNLKEEDIIKILNLLKRKDIKKIKLTDEYIYLSYDDMNVTLTEDFFEISDKYDIYVNDLRGKVKKYVEDEALKKIKNKNTKINRNKNKKGQKMLVASSLITSLLLTSLGLSLKEAVKKTQLEDDDKTPVLSDVTSDLLEDDVKILNDLVNNANNKEVKTEELGNQEEVKPKEEIIEEPVKEDIMEADYNFDYEFLDLTKTGKLEETKEYLGDYIKHYATRWGLPVNLVMAQVTQERPSVVEGRIKNPCQITEEIFINHTFKMPVYDEAGFTGTYDTFTVTKASLGTYEGNIMTGIAYLRECVDSSKSLITGLYLYNQGEPSLWAACGYFGLNLSDYKGDNMTKEACELIKNYNIAAHGNNYGDYYYLANVFQYLETSNRGAADLSYYLGSEKIDININNTLNHEVGISRG